MNQSSKVLSEVQEILKFVQSISLCVKPRELEKRNIWLSRVEDIEKNSRGER